MVAITGCALAKSDDDGELHHITPAHKPASFAAAVPDLRSRLNELTDTESVSVDDLRRRELLDILIWLPELAGDSDLEKADWDLVQRTVAELEQLLASGPTSGAIPSATVTAMQQKLDLLTPLMARSQQLVSAGSTSRTAKSSSVDPQGGN